MLDAVRPVPYALEYHGVWSLDIDSLRHAITPRTRALLIVSPNNPTGSMLKARERDAIVQLCASHDLALIGDEVFADYLFEDADPARESVLAQGQDQDRVLTFALGGLSKSAGLPQLKLGWIVMKGPAARCAEAAERLDLICDTYLSVATPVQRAVAVLLEQGTIVRGRIQARLDANRRALQRALAQAPGCSLLHLEAGWSAVVRVPAIHGEEALALDLLSHDRVLVAPGYFYDFPREAYLVVSLLPDPDVFAAGVDRMLTRAQAALSSL
jgi:aspartate/methionine/tyrosine aminotransferase